MYSWSVKSKWVTNEKFRKILICSIHKLLYDHDVSSVKQVWTDTSEKMIYFWCNIPLNYPQNKWTAHAEKPSCCTASFWWDSLRFLKAGFSAAQTDHYTDPWPEVFIYYWVWDCRIRLICERVCLCVWESACRYELYIHIQMLPSCREALITDSQSL